MQKKYIDKKISSGFYKRVDYSEWASTTHIVVKKNGQYIYCVLHGIISLQLTHK